MAAIGVGSTGSWREASFIMRKPPPDYTALEHEAWKKNASQVVARLDEDEPNLLKRIATFVRRFGFHVHEVRQKILSDPMFRAHFAIEPRRQGFHEKIASKWIRSLPDISDFRVLPKSGRNAVYITSDGEVRQGLRKPPSKSLDFTWQADGRQFYAAHKYTLEGGGNQDSQFNEMRSLLEHFQKAHADSNIVLFVIVDGPYYTDAKMDDLRRFARSSAPFSYAVPIEDLPDTLERLRESD